MAAGAGVPEAAAGQNGAVHAAEKLEIPLVDLGGRDNTPERRAEVVKQLKAAAEVGIFQVVNTGIEMQVLQDVRRVGQHFFSLPLEEKLKVKKQPGFRAVGFWTEKDSADSTAAAKRHRHCYEIEAFPLFRQERITNWPSNPADFRKCMLAYTNELKGLGLWLLGALSEGLGLPVDTFEKAVQEPYMNSTLFLYLKEQVEAGKKRVPGLGPHTDIPMLGFLLQDGVEGLQGFRDGQWITCPLKEDGIVMTVGDQLELLSNGRYHSPVHRVVTNSTVDRFSVVATIETAPDVLVTPVPELVDAEHPCRYKPTRFHERLDVFKQKFTRADLPKYYMLAERSNDLLQKSKDLVFANNQLSVAGIVELEA